MSKKLNENLTWKDIYDLVDEKVGKLDEKLDTVVSKVSNIEGRLMMVPILISSGISIFFFIINLVVGGKP